MSIVPKEVVAELKNAAILPNDEGVDMDLLITSVAEWALEQAARECEKQDGEHDSIYAAAILAMIDNNERG